MNRIIEADFLPSPVEEAKEKPRILIIDNSDLPPETQEYMEDYIVKFVPRNRIVYHWFDVYDLEEERL